MRQASATQQLLIRHHPFSADPGVVVVTSGQTIRQMLLQATGGAAPATDVVVRVGGHPVPETLWDRVRPKPGAAILCYRQDPLHGGSARQILGAVLMAALAFYAPVWGNAIAGALGLGASAAGAIGIGIGVLGSAEVPALVEASR